MITEEKGEALLKKIRRELRFPTLTVSDTDFVHIDMDCPYDCQQRSCGGWCPLFDVDTHRSSTTLEVRLRCSADLAYKIKVEDVNFE